MAYSALYRRFRPDTFSGIIGQPHITTILLNQIRSGRVAHAYLFCGSRGTGKTSTARILAKAINCLDPQDGEPCLKCEACLSENNVDIIEIDAASNSRVEEMRALIERAEFAPLRLKKKVYIIDEAHMLTKNASNALLKTLEEPPEHVVFILATTEPQMLPATIVSRCQRFEFHRLSVAEMTASLKQNLDAMGAHIDEGGLNAIARAAEGGMRDCLSIADQCISFCGDNVTEDDVLSVLGSVNVGFLFGVADAIIASDAAEVMRCVESVASGGRDMGVFTQDLSSHFRALLITKICGDCRDILDCTPDAMREYSAQAERISKARAERAVEELIKLQLDLKQVNTPRTLVESCLLRICRPQDENTVLALQDRIAELENAVEGMKNDVAQAANEAVKRSVEQASVEIKNKVASSKLPVKTKTPTASAASEQITDQFESDDFDEAPALVPDASADSDELYKKLMSKLGEHGFEPTLAVALSTSKAHWVEDGVLHICFDRAGRQLYSYARDSAMRTVLNEAAKQSISPFTVELDLKNSAVVKQKSVKELFGVPITEV